MAVGSGLSAQLGIVTESTPGTPLAVTRFYEFEKETMSEKKHTVQGVGLRAGALTKRGSRRVQTAREAGGTVGFDIPTSGFGLTLQHMLGSFSTTATSLGGGLFQQIHNTGSLQGKAFTTQIVKPDYTGVLTQNAYTHTGCKITDWTISGQTEGQLKVDLTIDSMDQFTPSNSFAATTLASGASAAATTVSSTATIATGNYILIAGNTPTQNEVVAITNVSGAGPFTLTVSPALAYAHASGNAVSSPTAVNYGSPAALQAASYTAGTSIFSYDATGSQLIAGGSTSVVSGVWTNTGGTVVGNVRSFSLKGTNPMKVDRFGIGSALKSEPIENDYRSYSLEAEVEYGSPYFYQNYAADTGLALLLKFTAPGGQYLQFYMPYVVQNDGTDPEVSGPDILIPKIQFEVLDDGTNGAIQGVLVNTDAAV